MHWAELRFLETGSCTQPAHHLLSVAPFLMAQTDTWSPFPQISRTSREADDTMASNHPVRLRAYSSPSRPRTNPIADRSTTHEHGLGSDPANPHKTVELTPTKKGTPPSPSSPSSPQAGPLRMFRERLRRPSSAGGALSERKDSQERPNVLTRKPPRVKRVKSRPSTSSGVPDRNAPKPSQESLPPRFSMSTARKRRESSVPPLIVSSEIPVMFLIERAKSFCPVVPDHH